MPTARVYLLMLALSVVGLTGCGNSTSGAGGDTSAPQQADYAVEVEVEPASATLSASGGEFEVVFTITNQGKSADTYNLEAGDEFFGEKVIGDAVPATLTLAAGESKDLAIPVTFEGGGSLSTEFDLSITAVSQADPAITDTGACRVSVE